MKRTFIALFFISLFLNSFSQVESPRESWNTYWISHPDISQTSYNIVHFRKKFIIDSIPSEFNILITADNRYRLYINGNYAGYGPQQSDIRHYRYDQLDISSYLNKGENLIAVEVINWGVERGYGIISAKTGFLLQGKSSAEEIINTSQPGWKCYQNKAYSRKTVNWMYGVDITGGFYASCHGDSLKAEKYPWNWHMPGYNDQDWAEPAWANSAVSSGNSFFWILEPRNTPLVQYSKERFKSIERCSGIEVNNEFLSGNAPLVIPPNTKASILIDQEELTLGYPELTFSGGENASIIIIYAESLYYPDHTKGHRDISKDKSIIGIKDVIIADGGRNRKFKPFYHKAFRYIQLDIQSFDEELIISDYYNEKTVSPIKFVAEFECDRDYSAITDICKHTLRLCTQDNFVSDAYYETMQYVGDSRPHAFAWNALTGDKRHFRNALQQFHYSVLPDGNITSCYPLKSTFVHPTYSLMWIDMIYDYMMYYGEKELIRNWVTDIDGVLDFFERIKNENGIPGKSGWNYFVDWYTKENSGGISPVSINGNSALVTLHLVYSLQRAAKIMEWLDDSRKAEIYQNRANEYIEIVNKLFYKEDIGMYSEDPEGTFLDQRANIMAVLTDAIPPEKQKDLLNRVIDNPDLSRAGLYYRFNFFDALAHAEAGEYFDRVLAPWWEAVKLGLSTTPERPVDENPRSESHPWAASPIWAYYHVYCGIRPVEAGFSKGIIAPSPGNLSFIKAEYPHPAGILEIDLRFRKSGPSGTIIIPEGTDFSFVWKGKKKTLKAGLNKI